MEALGPANVPRSAAFCGCQEGGTEGKHAVALATLTAVHPIPKGAQDPPRPAPEPAIEWAMLSGRSARFSPLIRSWVFQLQHYDVLGSSIILVRTQVRLVYIF